jgi:Mg-chelatase subunit ChlD
MLADLTGATDVRLRELARRLAGRLLVDLARAGRVQSRGVGKLRSVPADRAQGDLDLDASIEPLLLHRATGAPPALDELRAWEWAKPSTALCVLVDRSGSMGGERLAAAALAAAACAWRAPEDHSVLAFSSKVTVVKGQRQVRPTTAVVDDVLSLRGHGTTDLSLALRAAAAQLATSRAKRRLTILLSDCRPTEGRDPLIDAGQLDELVIVAPADDAEDAATLAGATGSRWVPLRGPSDIPAAFAELLDR